MDNSIKKWLVRAGSFLILFGFFIPSMAVSCVGQEQSFSMNTAASQLNQGVLYLVLAGALIAIVFSFLVARTNQQRYLFIFGEGGGLGLGILGILISVATLYSQMQQLGLEFKIKAGFFVLFLGYCAAGFGIILELFEPARKDTRPQYGAPTPNFAPPVYSPPPPIHQPSAAPRLELVSGNAPRSVPISNPDFHIGRSSQNDCPINDPQISRVHVRIRGAQGSWFIQDQESAGGTFVNGKRIQAQRLNDGDEVCIGETTFRFRM
ncbi:MAG: FHA domain-containing protein [Anaerolineales bacterium]|nr:FHA domain-containing protein [Anaerolineales bacterium]